MAKALHGLPSMSKSALLLSPCIGWAGPQARWFDESKVDKSDTVKRDQGTEFHQLIDRHQKHGSIEPAVPCHEVMSRIEHAVRYLEQVLGPRCDSIQSEVVVGYNWLTGEAYLAPEAKDRNYPNIAGVQWGTADLVCVLKTGELLVADWKTGGNDGATEQLLSLGVAFKKAMDKEGFLYTLCLQVNEYGVYPHEKTYTDGQCRSHADAMRFQWEDIGKRNDTVPGIHCTTLYCPHLAYCPSVSGIVGEAASKNMEEPLVSVASLARFKMTDKPSSNEEAGFVMARISAAKRQMKYWEKSIQDYCIKAGGKATSGQYEWGPGGNGWRWRKN